MKNTPSRRALALEVGGSWCLLLIVLPLIAAAADESTCYDPYDDYWFSTIQVPDDHPSANAVRSHIVARTRWCGTNDYRASICVPIVSYDVVTQAGGLYLQGDPARDFGITPSSKYMLKGQPASFFDYFFENLDSDIKYTATATKQATPAKPWDTWNWSQHTVAANAWSAFYGTSRPNAAPLTSVKDIPVLSTKVPAEFTKLSYKAIGFEVEHPFSVTGKRLISCTAGISAITSRES